MNICMFTNTYLPHLGGVARSVSLFEQDLRALGHNLLIIAPTYPDLGGGEVDEANVLRVPAIQNFNGSDFSLRIPIPFLIDEKINQFLPDIIHSHHPYLLGDAAMRAANRRFLPLIFTHHTLYEEYTHYVPGTSEAMKRFVIHLSTTYANCCTHVVAPSRSIAELIRSRGVTTPVIEIPTGIDFVAFQTGDGLYFRRKYAIPENAELIGHLGRLAPEKNLRYLAQAVKIYLLRNENARFLLVGDGPSLTDIEVTFAEAGLTGRLVWTGKLTGKDLLNAYSAMDLFVFTSHTETQGLVVVEAMAAKTPVIALDASGVREVLEDNRNGRLLPAGAPPEAFADAIAAFFKNRSMESRWQKNALETARHFDRMSSARKLVDLYDLARRTTPKPEKEYRDIFRSWEYLLQALRTEWDLLTGKIGAVAQMIPSRERRNKDGDFSGEHGP